MYERDGLSCRSDAYLATCTSVVCHLGLRQSSTTQCHSSRRHDNVELSNYDMKQEDKNKVPRTEDNGSVKWIGGPFHQWLLRETGCVLSLASMLVLLTFLMTLAHQTSNERLKQPQSTHQSSNYM